MHNAWLFPTKFEKFFEKRVSLPLVKFEEGRDRSLSCSLYSALGVGLCSSCELIPWESSGVLPSFSADFNGSVWFSLKSLFVVSVSVFSLTGINWYFSKFPI